MIDVVSFLSGTAPWAFARGDAIALLRALPDESIDNFLTDPPYGIELKLGSANRGRGGRSIAGDGKAEARKLWRAFVPECYRAAKPNTSHVFFATWKSPWMHAILSRSFDVKGCIVWDKKLIGLGHYLRPRFELAFFCVKGKPPRRGTAPADVWQELRVMRPQHPCEKPVPLLQKAVRLLASRESVVCDPFSGIATSGVAALMEGCRFLGSEIDVRHHRLGTARLKAAEKTYFFVNESSAGVAE